MEDYVALVAAGFVAVITFIVEGIVEDTVLEALFAPIYWSADYILQTGYVYADLCAFLIRLIPPLVNAAVTFVGFETLAR